MFKDLLYLHYYVKTGTSDILDLLMERERKSTYPWTLKQHWSPSTGGNHCIWKAEQGRLGRFHAVSQKKKWGAGRKSNECIYAKNHKRRIKRVSVLASDSLKILKGCFTLNRLLTVGPWNVVSYLAYTRASALTQRLTPLRGHSPSTAPDPDKLCSRLHGLVNNLQWKHGHR